LIAEIVFCLLDHGRLSPDASLMDAKKTERRAGDFFIDRYMPKASEAKRHEARANLRSLIRIIVAIDDRLRVKAQQKRDSRESAS
jgi:hypothetical protein